MLWYRNAVYLSNCIYAIVLNATKDIFLLVYSPLNVVITDEGPEWSCALFMSRSDTATTTSHPGKLTHSQPAKGERSSLATVPRLLPARFSVASNSLLPQPQTSFSVSFQERALPCACPPLCNFPFVPTRYILSVFLQRTKLLGLTSSLPKHDGENHQFR